ncbi:MAG: delta-60 repeat domain-containing protein [Verrucomicrobiaceae bacterium]
MLWQPDGKIIIGGSFTSSNGTPRNTMARRNVDGSPDSTFAPLGRVATRLFLPWPCRPKARW